MREPIYTPASLNGRQVQRHWLRNTQLLRMSQPLHRLPIGIQALEPSVLRHLDDLSPQESRQRRIVREHAHHTHALADLTDETFGDACRVDTFLSSRGGTKMAKTSSAAAARSSAASGKRVCTLTTSASSCRGVCRMVCAKVVAPPGQPATCLARVRVPVDCARNGNSIAAMLPHQVTGRWQPSSHPALRR